MILQAEASEHHLILGAVLMLVGKIVWDWLSSRKSTTRNGQESFERMAMMEILRDLQERQKKMWEHLLEKEK
jgi:hypothetical protein